VELIKGKKRTATGRGREGREGTKGRGREKKQKPQKGSCVTTKGHLLQCSDKRVRTRERKSKRKIKKVDPQPRAGQLEDQSKKTEKINSISPARQNAKGGGVRGKGTDEKFAKISGSSQLAWPVTFWGQKAVDVYEKKKGGKAGPKLTAAPGPGPRRELARHTTRRGRGRKNEEKRPKKKSYTHLILQFTILQRKGSIGAIKDEEDGSGGGKPDANGPGRFPLAQSNGNSAMVDSGGKARGWRGEPENRR